MTDRSIPRLAYIRTLIAARPGRPRHKETGALALITALMLGGCTAEQPQADDAAVTADTSGHAMDDMPGMSGMPGMGDDMSAMMAHMQRMRGTRADSMLTMLPMHRQMAANMLAQMNREMRDMNMTADARWNATVDSLRTDLTRMPEMSGSELEAMMAGHQDRMMRLMEMHRTMMSEMR